MQYEKFVHLQVYSEFSLEKSLLRINDIIAAAQKNQQAAVVLTDLNLFAVIKFYQAAQKAKIKPIIGCEIKIADAKFLLLCQTNQGYLNLLKIISAPTELTLENTQGLIAIALNIDINFIFYKKIFGSNFLLGVTRIGKTGEEALFKKTCALAQEHNIPLVALNAVCFLNPEDFEAHEARVCINQGRILPDPKRPKLFTEEQYFKPSAEMQKLFADCPSAIENTYRVAISCNVKLELNKVLLPEFPIPNSALSIDQYLADLAKTGLKKRQLASNPIYLDRLELELKVIAQMGYAGYFLIVADFIQWAKQNNIPVGPGRGSGAGSLVAYALEITDIEPLKYNLLFERFLNPERVSMPDFDIDFCMEQRDKVIQYVADRYGHDSVCQIITFGTMTAKAVVRDAGRVLGMPYGFVDMIAKLIPFDLGMTLDKALESEEQLKQRYKKDDEVATLINLAKKLEGLARNAGKHAGGVVIAPGKLTNYVPLYHDPNEHGILTQLDKNDVETVGLVKFDFLGLRTLTIIDWAVQNINRNNPEPIDISKINLDDVEVFKLTQAGNTTAVFQLESNGMKALILRLKPDKFEDLIALVALFRPGPLQSGMVDDFIERKHGRAQNKYLHPQLIKILEPTYGVILYQEQVMQIAQVLAGYTLGAADLLRRAMGKKKPEEMARQREIFVKGAINNQVDHETAEQIFDLMEKFAGYGFNKSHSAAYAMLTYQTAWLKAHYPEYFMAAVLSADLNNTDKIMHLIQDCKLNNLIVDKPEINYSYYHFTVNADKKIIYGLGAIKGLGEAAINLIISEREKNGLFKTMQDLATRVDLRQVNKRGLEALIKSGACDNLDPTQNRRRLFLLIEKWLAVSAHTQKTISSGQFDLFGNQNNNIEIDLNIPEPQQDNTDKLSDEKSSLGFYLTGHPITEYYPWLRALDCTPLNKLEGLTQEKKSIRLAGYVMYYKTRQTKTGKRMAILWVDDYTARYEMAIFSDLYQEAKSLLDSDELLCFEADYVMDKFTEKFRLRINNIMDFNTALSKWLKKIKIVVKNPNKLEILSKLIKNNSGKFPVELEYQHKLANIKFKPVYINKAAITQQELKTLQKQDLLVEL